jgi:hypothetical protein
MNPANALTCGPSRPILGILLLAMFLAFWGSLGVAAHYDPVQYDWRYRVISTLLSPCDNPAFFAGFSRLVSRAPDSYCSRVSGIFIAGCVWCRPGVRVWLLWPLSAEVSR